MQAILLHLAMAAAFGTFVGSLFRLSRKPGSQRPMLFPLIGLAAGIAGYAIFYLLSVTTGAPAWLLPLLVVLQTWLWLGPLGPRFDRHRDS